MHALIAALLLAHSPSVERICPDGQVVRGFRWNQPPMCVVNGAGGGGAPTTAHYVTTQAEAGLSAEAVLPTCPVGQALTFDGATISCYTPTLTLRLDQLANPTGDTTFTYPSGKKMLWTFTGSTDNAFSVHGDGAFTGTGDLVHIHKTGTGSTAGADALHVEVDTDANMTGLRVTMPAATRTAISTNGGITADKLTLTHVTGSDGLAMTTGARLHLGGGTTDYLTSNGTTTITAAGSFNASSFTASSSINGQAFNSNPLTGAWAAQSNLPAALSGPVFKLQALTTQTVNDLIRVTSGPAAGVTKFRLAFDGTGYFAGAVDVQTHSTFWDGITVASAGADPGWVWGRGLDAAVFAATAEVRGANISPSVVIGSSSTLAAGNLVRFANGEGEVSAIDYQGNFNGRAATATALAADGYECIPGEAARGVDVYGNAQGCWAPPTYGNATTITPGLLLAHATPYGTPTALVRTGPLNEWDVGADSTFKLKTLDMSGYAGSSAWVRGFYATERDALLNERRYSGSYTYRGSIWDPTIPGPTPVYAWTDWLVTADNGAGVPTESLYRWHRADGSGAVGFTISEHGAFSGNAATATALASSGTTSQFWRGDNTWAVPPGGSPGGADTQIQYNDSGAFAGTVNMSYSTSTGVTSLKALTVTSATNTDGVRLTGGDNASGDYGASIAWWHPTDAVWTRFSASAPGRAFLWDNGGVFGIRTPDWDNATVRSQAVLDTDTHPDEIAGGAHVILGTQFGETKLGAYGTVDLAYYSTGGVGTAKFSADASGNITLDGQTGDLNLSSTLGSVKILPAGTTSQFWRGDNSWATPSVSFSGLTAGGAMYANTTTTVASTGTGTPGRSVLASGGTGAPTWAQGVFGVTMTQDRAPSGTITTGQTTTDLTWAINANEGQTFTCNLTSTSTAASKLRYAVAGPASMAYVNCRTLSTTTTLTTGVSGMLQGQWASTCTNCTPSVTASVLTSKLTDVLSCTVTNGANAGNITIYFAASAAANTNTLHKGSGCVVTGGG